MRKTLLVAAAVAMALPYVVAKPPTKQKVQVLSNPAKSIYVLSAKKEKLVDFFRRQRLAVGGLDRKLFEKAVKAKKPLEKLFLSYSSFNDNRSKESLFGAIVNLAPISKQAAKLVRQHGKAADGKLMHFPTVIIRQDKKDEKLYHVVGVMKLSPVGFFARKKGAKEDKFKPTDLRYQEKK